MDAPNLLHTFPSYSLQVSLPQYKEHNFFSQNFWPLLFKLIFQIQIQQLSTSHLVKVPLFLFNINAFKNLLCVEKLWLLSDFLKVLFFFFHIDTKHRTLIQNFHVSFWIHLSRISLWIWQSQRPLKRTGGWYSRRGLVVWAAILHSRGRCTLGAWVPQRTTLRVLTLTSPKSDFSPSLIWIYNFSRKCESYEY